MRKLLTRTTGLIGLVAAAGVVAQPARDFSAIEITTHPVADNVYYLEGAGGNIAVLTGAEGVLLVDTQFAPLTEKIVAAVAAITDEPIRVVVNTHVHPDHTGGNENLRRMGYPVLAHDNVRVRMAQGIRGGEPSPPLALPSLTFGDELGLHLAQDVRLIKVPPAHTDGDTYVHFIGADVLHMGDVFRTTGYPVIDVDNGGSAAGTLAALELALEIAGPDTRIIPGHGVVSSADDVREFHDMIAEVAERVSGLIDEGMTLEQVLAAAPTADIDERWGGEPERFLTGLYQSLAGADR
ncbi:MAG: MBL fold metallo-hydrolase [Gammaproteobacteria bacterium]|jgi:glyoxylase-like metal-dependent hydrolase (beta-lactamase superfamily II)